MLWVIFKFSFLFLNAVNRQKHTGGNKGLVINYMKGGGLQNGRRGSQVLLLQKLCATEKF